MSADNGIYILKTKDQYRVAHFQNAEYMYYSIEKNGYENNVVPVRAVELWGDSKFTRKEDVALRLAHKWASSLWICEYGVNIITYDGIWKELLIKAARQAREEIGIIKENRDEKSWNMDKLFKIESGHYLTEWRNRERYNEDLRKHECGYWSVCFDKGCPCSIDKNVNGFDNEVYKKLGSEYEF